MAKEEAGTKLLGSKHMSLRKRMKEKQWPKSMHLIADDEHNDASQTTQIMTDSENKGNHMRDDICRRIHTIEPPSDVPAISAVVSMDEEGLTPKAEAGGGWKSEQGPTVQPDPLSNHSSVMPTVVIANISASSTSSNTESTTILKPFQQQNETTLIGQDYLSSDDELSLPLEAYNINEMHQILKNLGDSFLNASDLEDQSPIKQVFEANDDDLHADDRHKSMLNDLSTVEEVDHLFEQEPTNQQDDINTVNNNLYNFPFPSGHSYIQQVTDSSLLQASLTSEASTTPSPKSKPAEWKSYKSRNQYLQDRNASLLKEIRFAEQTCVELSHDKQFVNRELQHVQRLLEEEFASKKQLLAKLEHLAQAHDLLQQDLENEKKHSQELSAQLQHERQDRHEMERQYKSVAASDALLQDATEQLAKERHDKLELMEQIAEARLSVEDLQNELEKEREVKANLKTALHQTLQHVEELQKKALEVPGSSDLSMRSTVSPRVANQAQQQRNNDAPSSSLEDVQHHLMMRVEELEAQNAHLRRQIAGKTDEPDGLLPGQWQKKPDAPNDLSNELEGDSTEEEEHEEEDSVERRLHVFTELFAKLESVESEFGEYKKQEDERLDSAFQKLKQQQSIEWTSRLNSLQKENRHLEDELTHQRNLASGLKLRYEESIAEAKRENQRVQDELLKERRVLAELEEQLTALQKEYHRVSLSDMSLRSSLSDVKERLAHVEHELVVSQKTSESLRKQVQDNNGQFDLQLQAERRILQDEFLQALSKATQRLDNQASAMEAELVQLLETSSCRVLNLTSAVQKLRSNGCSDRSGEVNSRNESDNTSNNENQIPNQSVLNATFRRSERHGNESVLHDLEEALLSNVDEGIMYMSEISHDNSVNAGWLHSMDISQVDENAVLEVKKLQSSLSEAQSQLKCHLATIGALEEQIAGAKEARQLDQRQIFELKKTLSSHEVTIEDLHSKLKRSFSSSSSCVSRLDTFSCLDYSEQQLDTRQSTEHDIELLQNSIAEKESKIATLQSTLEALENRKNAEGLSMKNSMEELELKIAKLQAAKESLHEEVRNLSNTVIEKETILASLTAKLQLAEQSREDTKRNWKNSLANHETMSTKLQMIEESRREETRTLRNSILEKEAVVADLQVKLQMAENSRFEYEQNLRNTITTQEANIVKLRIAAESREDEFRLLRSSIAEHEAMIVDLQARLQHAERNRDRDKQNWQEAQSMYESKIAELLSDYESHKQQAVNLQVMAAENEATIADLEAKLQSAEAFGAQSQEMEIALRDAEAEIDRLRTAYLSCNDRLAAAFDAMASSEDLIGRFKESSDEAVKTSIEAAEIARSRNDQLTHRIELLETTLERTKTDLRECEAEKLNMDAVNSELQRTLSETKQERDATRIRLAEVESNVIRLTSEKDNIDKEIQISARTQRDLEARVLNIEHAKISLAQQLDGAMESLTHTSKERDALQMELMSTGERLAAAEGLSVRLSDELTAVKKSHASALCRHADVVAQLKMLASTNSDKVKELEESLAVSTSELSSLRFTFVELNDRIASLSEDKLHSKKRIKSLEESLASSEADLVESQQQLSSRESQLDKLRADIRQAMDEGQDSKEKIVELQDQLVCALSEQEVLRQAVTKAEESVQRSTKEFSAYKLCMEDRISERQAVVCEIQSFSETKQRELREKLVLIQKSRDDLQRDVLDALADFGNHLVESSVKVAASFDSGESWQETLLAVKNLVSRIIDYERERSFRLEAKLSDAHLELERAASDICENAKELSETRNVVETLQRSLAEKVEMVTYCCQERDDAQSRLVFITGKLEEATRDQDAAKLQAADTDVLLLHLRQEISALKIRAEQLESKNDKLRDYIRKLTSKCEEWQESWEQQSKIILELRSE